MAQVACIAAEIRFLEEPAADSWAVRVGWYDISH
jgi:hypothetical protein